MTDAPQASEPAAAPAEPAIQCAHSEVWPLDNFTPHPRNPNKHPAEQLRLLGKIIIAHGWRSPVVVSTRSRLVIKGHGRLEAARLVGLTVAPVDLQAYGSEAEELADLVADNRLSELSEMSGPDLKGLLDELGAEGAFDLELAGFSTAALDDLMKEPARPEGAFTYVAQYGVIVVCAGESEQKAAYDALTASGYTCKVVVT